MRQLIPIVVLACVLAVLASPHLSVGAAISPFFSAPNLVVEYIDAPDTARPGHTVPVSNTIKNQIDPSECVAPGSCDAGSFTVKFYLSTDTVITTTDTLLGQRIITELLASESDFAVTNLTITDGVADYYLGAIADADNEVIETDETDNTGYDFITTIQGQRFLPMVMKNARAEIHKLYLPFIVKGYRVS